MNLPTNHPRNGIGATIQTADGTEHRIDTTAPITYNEYGVWWIPVDEWTTENATHHHVGTSTEQGEWIADTFKMKTRALPVMQRKPNNKEHTQ